MLGTYRLLLGAEEKSAMIERSRGCWLWTRRTQHPLNETNRGMLGRMYCCFEKKLGPSQYLARRSAVVNIDRSIGRKHRYYTRSRERQQRQKRSRKIAATSFYQKYFLRNTYLQSRFVASRPPPTPLPLPPLHKPGPGALLPCTILSDKTIAMDQETYRRLETHKGDPPPSRLARNTGCRCCTKNKANALILQNNTGLVVSPLLYLKKGHRCRTHALYTNNSFTRNMFYVICNRFRRHPFKNERPRRHLDSPATPQKRQIRLYLQVSSIILRTTLHRIPSPSAIWTGEH